jgi:hypothetical protein
LQVSNLDNAQNKFANSVSYTQAALVAGVAIAWGYINPSSALGYLSTIVSGAVGTVLGHGIVYTACDAYDKWCHRAHRPLILDEKTPQYEQKLESAFKKIQVHPNYGFFKEFLCDKDDNNAYQFLKKLISKGCCMGSAIVLLKTIENKQDVPCSELLNAMHMEDVLYCQLLECMKVGFERKESGLRKIAWEIKAPNHPDLSFKNEYTPFGNKYPEEEPNNAGLSKILSIGKYLKQIVESLEKDLVSWKELESPIFFAKQPAKVFQQQLEQLVKSKSFSGDPRRISGRVIITGDESDRLNGKSGHVITFQCENGKFRFYDTTDFFSGGFYEYLDQTEFFKALKRQILDDVAHLNYNNTLITLCLKNGFSQTHS